MREILFRGKRLDNDEWVKGSFCMDALELKNGPCGVDGFIRLYDFNKVNVKMYEVDRDTVGQYTGLTDKNGKKIFEGDIVRALEEGEVIGYCEIKFGEYSVGHVGFYADWYAGRMAKYFRNDLGYWVTHKTIEVISNIHDNRELLEGEA